MKTSLRIGNTIQEGTIKSFYEYGVHVGNGKCYNYSEINPIPITSVHLTKLGFVDEELIVPNTNIVLNQHHGVIQMLAICYSVGSSFRYNTKVSCESLHELQNLYHALTGNELSEKVTKPVDKS